MNDRGRGPRADCDSVRAAIHARLDGEEVERASRADVDAHLAHCAPCRAFASDLERIGDVLRSLGTAELPEIALRRVWKQTSRLSRPWPHWIGWSAAAAILLVAAGLALWSRVLPRPAEPTDAELRQAAAQARWVLSLTARTLERAERRAVRQVLTEEVSDVLRRAHLDWPDAEPRRSGRPST